MAGKPAVKGTTPQERRDLRERRREVNRIQHLRNRVAAAENGRERVVAACNAALAVSKRITDEARRDLANEIARAVTAADRPENRREAS